MKIRFRIFFPCQYKLCRVRTTRRSEIKKIVSYFSASVAHPPSVRSVHNKMKNWEKRGKLLPEKLLFRWGGECKSIDRKKTDMFTRQGGEFFRENELHALSPIRKIYAKTRIVFKSDKYLITLKKYMRRFNWYFFHINLSTDFITIKISAQSMPRWRILFKQSDSDNWQFGTNKTKIPHVKLSHHNLHAMCRLRVYVLRHVACRQIRKGKIGMLPVLIYINERKWRFVPLLGTNCHRLSQNIEKP